MEIVICDYCYKRNGSVNRDVVDMIPEFTLAKSRRRIKAKAICAEDLEMLFPEEQDEKKRSSLLPQVGLDEPGYVDLEGAAALVGKASSSMTYYVGKGLNPKAKSGNKNMFLIGDVMDFAKDNGWTIDGGKKAPAKVGRKRV